MADNSSAALAHQQQPQQHSGWSRGGGGRGLWLVGALLVVALFGWFMYTGYFTFNCWPRQVQGIVDDCCCEMEAVDKQADFIHSSLEALRASTFFKFFKVNPFRDCSLWVEEYLCSMIEGGGCGICVCDEEEIPKPWTLDQFSNDYVDSTVPTSLQQWNEDTREVWTNIQNDPQAVYLNLDLNPERYTGYGGYQSTRIWTAIYKENCFLHEPTQNNTQQPCFEERVLFRLISGFHASTTAHICESYHNPVTGKWYPHTEMFKWRLAANPEHIKNIYFTLLFLLRATAHAAPFLHAYPYNTGNPVDDHKVTVKMGELLKMDLLQTCAPTFNESLMFQSEPTGEHQHLKSLRGAIRAKFHNISEIMDCIGCESCKVHAKLQLLGIGTALKILLADNPQHRAHIIEHLQRNEIIGLVNTLLKFSESVQIIKSMHGRLWNACAQRIGVAAFLAFLFVVLLVQALRSPLSRSAALRTPAHTTPQTTPQSTPKSASTLATTLKTTATPETKKQQ
eukprot:TRINITY_DN3780_c0_g1_i2.p1 TRINITY_DN3780_c0_g1~~TRINITY_DN3780_c0_g1_i2.p1  ORF type:complete len:508 (-),score=82.88 TRINITY_DN3780_c0_g1_i2:28-1551(-)